MFTYPWGICVSVCVRAANWFVYVLKYFGVMCVVAVAVPKQCTQAIHDY